jgi:hypothetical protein
VGWRRVVAADERTMRRTAEMTISGKTQKRLASSNGMTPNGGGACAVEILRERSKEEEGVWREIVGSF